MEEQLINIETTTLAKEKGFDISTRHFYADESWNSREIYACSEVGYGEFTDSMESNHGFGDITLIPTQSLLQKWLRDKHNIAVLVSFNDNNVFEYYYFIHTNVSKAFSNRICSLPLKFSSYEESLEFGLTEGLKLIEIAGKEN